MLYIQVQSTSQERQKDARRSECSSEAEAGGGCQPATSKEFKTGAIFITSVLILWLRSVTRLTQTRSTGTRFKKTYVVFVAEPHGRNGLFKTFDWNAISTGVEVVMCDRFT